MNQPNNPLPNPQDIDQAKQWIDQAPYEELLSKWRFDPLDSPWFVGEVGEHFTAKLQERRQQAGDQHANVSKKVGWSP